MILYASPGTVFLIGFLFGVFGGYAVCGLTKGGRDE